ncbi:DUF2244 domain-containing protein [Alkalicaulis satelles]|uniref:DUF2244 domain-containing protein n=1 Tax=Alkalicaulis satelles TaxID=2609175 RepID=A0A5M6ZJ83_9PROT|nr:DUF2244 domain-containing protein [Alkalicaulis satelles]KAA5803804.1 DUF2244 domain-containing protein [Alkalicaulis satelles]
MERRRIYETWPSEAPPEPLAAGERLYLDAQVRPNRSLPNWGFYALMAAIALVSFTAGIAFMLIGAWPVLGFFGLDVALIWLAFRLSYRDGRRLETIQITKHEIRVGRRYPTGHQTWFRLPRAWTRVEIAGEGEPDVQARLTAKGKSLIIGSMLSGPERESLAAAVREAIEAAGQAPLAQESGGGAPV